MAEPKRRVTSADVARAAGVSPTTVSFVLNPQAKHPITPRTRDKVLEAARRLGYRPHPSAKALAAGRTDIVLLALPEFQVGPHLVRFVEGLDAALHAEGLSLVTQLGTAPHRPLPDVCASVAASIVLGLEVFERQVAADLYAAGASLVVPVEPAREADLYRASGRLQAEHLIARGHRRLGFAFPAHPSLDGIARKHRAGVESACADAGLAEPVSATVEYDTVSAAKAVDRWVGSGVTGVCAYNDETGLAVLAGLREHGLRPPEPIAVIGHDDLPLARLADPPLSTIGVDSRALGEELGRAVVGVFRGAIVPFAADPAVHLRVVERRST